MTAQDDQADMGGTKQRGVKFHIIVCGVLGVLGGAMPSHAQLTSVTSRATLAGQDSVDWGQLGPDGTPVPHPVNVTSTNGVTVTVSKALAGPFKRLDQSTSWNGNFAPGDKLLWTNDFGSTTTNPVALFNFSGTGITAGGAQIQSNFGVNFTARLEAFDSINTSLGVIDVPGVSNNHKDNSAIFVGFTSTVPVHRVAFSLVSAPFNSIGDFAINQFDFTADSDGDGVADADDACPGTVIPEEAVPTQGLGVNRFALVDEDTTFDTTDSKGKGPQQSFTVADTAGCSCEQIIEALDLGKGHEKYGCSISAMEDWISLMNP